MDKNVLVFLFMFLLCCVGVVKAQTGAVAKAGANIIDISNAAKVQFINSLSQIVPASNINTERPIQCFSENGKMLSSSVQCLSSFFISSENKYSFSVVLPSQPVILNNSKNRNTILVDGWQIFSQPDNNKSQQNIWIINLGGSLKAEKVIDKQEGYFSGTYPVNFVYN
jgi:predicted amino acid-binding ACT domain protein